MIHSSSRDLACFANEAALCWPAGQCASAQAYGCPPSIRSASLCQLKLMSTGKPEDLASAAQDLASYGSPCSDLGLADRKVWRCPAMCKLRRLCRRGIVGGSQGRSWESGKLG